MFGYKDRVYLDYAAATPVLPEVVRIIREHIFNTIGNPSSVHEEGRLSKEVLEESRKTVASFCGVKAREVYFTSGATEANNIAIRGTIERLKKEGRNPHIITSTIEHTSTLAVCKAYEREGGHVSYISPNSDGIVSPAVVSGALKTETALVSLSLVNSETGTEQSTKEIRRVLPEGVLFHIDAAQAPVYKAVNIHSLGGDLMTLDAQKIYGPKGAGALVAKTKCTPLAVTWGGGQERGLRPGTENVPLIAGFAHAFSVMERERKETGRRLEELSQILREQLLAEVTGVQFLGSQKHSAPHILSFSLPGVAHDYLAVILDERGFAVGTGSACAPEEGSISHVYRALGFTEGGIRVSFGRDTKEKDITRFVETLKTVLTEFDKI